MVFFASRAEAMSTDSLEARCLLVLGRLSHSMHPIDESRKLLVSSSRIHPQEVNAKTRLGTFRSSKAVFIVNLDQGRSSALGIDS